MANPTTDEYAAAVRALARFEQQHGTGTADVPASFAGLDPCSLYVRVKPAVDAALTVLTVVQTVPHGQTIANVLRAAVQAADALCGGAPPAKPAPPTPAQP